MADCKKRITRIINRLPIDNDPIITKAEAAADLSVSERTLDTLLPTIPHYRLGRRVLIRKSELDRWLERYREHPNDLDLQRIANEAVESVLGPPNPKKERK